MIIGGTFIGIFYRYGKDKWQGTEYIWEGSFAIVATLIITVVGGSLLRVSNMQKKWRDQLLENVQGGNRRRGCWERWTLLYDEYFFFALPFVTVLREGLEAVVFIAGVSFSAPASAVPLPVVMGLIAGAVVGYLIYK